MGAPEWVDVFPIENGDISASYVSLPREPSSVAWCKLLGAPGIHVTDIFTLHVVDSWWSISGKIYKIYSTTPKLSWWSLENHLIFW